MRVSTRFTSHTFHPVRGSGQRFGGNAAPERGCSSPFGAGVLHSSPWEGLWVETESDRPVPMADRHSSER
jgi:hypothetical protein